MKSKVLIKFVACVLVFSFILSGCSYVAFENSVKDKIDEIVLESTIDPNVALPNQEIPEELLSEVPKKEEASESETSQEDETDNADGIIYATRGENKIAIELKGIGDTYAELVKYKDSLGREVTSGKVGVYYTLNSVEVFDDFSDTDLSSEGKLLYSDAYFAQNQFILLEITANYIAPEGGEERIKVSPYLMASYVYEKMPDGFLSRISIENLEPIDAWFSAPPKEGDPELDPIHDKNCFMINNGESFTFKLGLLAGREFVNNGNVFLRVGYLSEDTKDAVHQYFELFPSENYDWALTKEEALFDEGKAYLIDNELLKQAVNVVVYTPNDKAVIKTTGETLPSFKAYKYENKDEIEYLGNNGVYVTLNNVTVYDSFEASGLTIEDLPSGVQDLIFSKNSSLKESIRDNYFILVDVTYEYIAPENGPDIITDYMGFSFFSFANKRVEKLDNDQIFIQTPSPLYNNFETNEEGYPVYTIKNGEKVSYRFGVSAGGEFVDNNNIYWCVTDIGLNFENDVFLLFDLLPEDK